MVENSSADQEKRVKRLRRAVEGWRVVVVELRDVLAWEQAWHPALIVGVLSLAYFLLWLIEPNSITLLASVGIIINLLDVCVPVLTARSAGAWTGTHERRLEDACRGAVRVLDVCQHHVLAFATLRRTKPLLYYAVSMAALLALLWVGRCVYSGRLAMAALTALVLAPGALRCGLPCQLRALLTAEKRD